MTDQITTNIRCRPDGSIDTAFYMAQGRNMRAQKAKNILRGNAPSEPKAPARRWFLAFLF